MKKDIHSKLSVKLLSLFSLGLFIISTHSFALPFNVIPKASTQLPTVIAKGQKITAYYTVQNNTLAARANNYVKYLPQNVVQITSEATYPDTCGSLFSLAGKGQPGSSCTLQLSITGPVNSADPDPHHHLFVCFPGGVTCAGTQSPLNVTVTASVLQTAYVTNFNSGMISRCPVLANGSFGVCTAAITALGQPAGISINKDKPYVYIAQPNYGIVLYCHINNDGTLNNCGVTPGASPFFAPGGIVVNPENTMVYVTAQSSMQVFYCPIANDGSLTGCNTTGMFNMPLGIAFNANGTYAYIAESEGSAVSSCPVNGNGSLGNCISNMAPEITLPYAVAINPTNTIAYVVNADNSVAYCTINSNNGSFNGCNLTGNGFNFPTAINLNAEGTYAFITNFNNNTVSSCPINSNGSFGNCAITGNDFFTPNGIALRTA